MTNTNIKTILFASLIAAMILPFSSMNMAEAQEVPTTTILQDMAPFVTINEDKTISFDKKSAKQAGMDRVSIKLAKTIVKEQNKLVKGEIKESAVLSTIVSATDHQQSATRSWGSSCDWGGQDSTPPLSVYPTYQSSVNNAKLYLVAIGYHQVADYARHSGQSDDDWNRNYQKSVAAHGCESGVFRAEAYIQGSSGDSYRYYSPEPNPEYKDPSYDWPVFYWPAYVANWHYWN